MRTILPRSPEERPATRRKWLRIAGCAPRGWARSRPTFARTRARSSRINEIALRQRVTPRYIRCFLRAKGRPSPSSC